MPRHDDKERAEGSLEPEEIDTGAVTRSDVRVTIVVFLTALGIFVV
jgi:hypothetical protein